MSVELAHVVELEQRVAKIEKESARQYRECNERYNEILARLSELQNSKEPRTVIYGGSLL